MDLAIISDSHIPGRATAIPDPFAEKIAVADHTIHAGDFETRAVVEEVASLANEFTAVHGNADPPNIGLPAVAAVDAGEITFVVTHGTLNHVEAAVYGKDGMVFGGEEWVRAIADTARARTRIWDGDGVIGIGGHTHAVEDTVYEGIRVLNPGSVTGADPAEQATMMTAEVDGDDVEVTLHEV